MSRARFAFAAHPDAIADLRELPDGIRDLALLELQNLVHGSDDFLPLKGGLAGFHKVYVDPEVAYRLVIQVRQAPPTSTHKREIYLVAAGSRKDYAVYRAAHLRTGPQQEVGPDSATEARVQAARSRSTLTAERPTADRATAPSTAPPSATAPPKDRPTMTNDRTALTRSELADLLAEAAQNVGGIPAAEYPTAAARSYLHPVLGPLAAGPRVITGLNDRFEGFVAAEPRPAGSAGLFALASYASALGWLTESFAELTSSVDEICTRVGIPTEPCAPIVAASGGTERGDEFDFEFSALELEAVRNAAEAAGLAPDDYVEVLSQSLLAAARITDACMEISSGLLDDADLLREASDHPRLGDDPGSLPALVRSLLARMEATE